MDARLLPITSVHPHPLNPRDDLGDLRELTEDIAAAGIIEPLVVIPGSHGKETGTCGDCGRTVDRVTSGVLAEHEDDSIPCPGGSEPAGDEWLIVAGHRRHAAAAKTRLTEVPCIIRWDLKDKPAVVLMMLRENIHRRNLTPVEELNGYHQLQLEGLTATRIAQQTRQQKKHVDRRLALANLTDTAKRELREGKITLDDAYTLLGLPPEDEGVVLRSVGTKAFKQEAARAHLKLVGDATDEDVARKLREDFLAPFLDGSTRPPETRVVWAEILAALAGNLPSRVVKRWLTALGITDPMELGAVNTVRAMLALAVTVEATEAGMYSLLGTLGYEMSPVEVELLEGA